MGVQIQFQVYAFQNTHNLYELLEINSIINPYQIGL